MSMGRTRPPNPPAVTASLQSTVRDLYRRASDADWAGDTATARRLERQAIDTIKAGEDPVPQY